MARLSLLLAASIAAAALIAPTAQAASKSPVRASLQTCKVSVDAAKRSLTFRAVVSSFAAGQRMEVRFDLLQRTGNGREVKVDGGGLGTWTRSGSGVTRYERFLTIQNLSAPATYRGAVRFRWLDARGHVLATALRYTGACVQPDLRPDLRAVPLGVRRGDSASTARYQMRVRNTGATPTGGFDLLLSIDGAARPALSVSSIAPFGRQDVTILAPRCTPGTGSIQVTLDPDNRVAESDETNNTLDLACIRPGAS